MGDGYARDDSTRIRLAQADREVKLKSVSIQIAKLLENYDRRERDVIVTEAKRLLGCTDKLGIEQQAKEGQDVA